jgi:uncharacterized membrane protein YkoI
VLWFPLSIWPDDNDHEEALRLKESGEILPLESILENVRQYHSGKVLEVELEKEQGIVIYEIKILDDDGILWEVTVNAITGQVMAEEEED